jgi:hypothetical protein
MGSSCVQCTFQCCNINEARLFYDALVPLAPIMLAITANCPIFRGTLVDRDCRWSIIAASVMIHKRHLIQIVSFYFEQVDSRRDEELPVWQHKSVQKLQKEKEAEQRKGLSKKEKKKAKKAAKKAAKKEKKRLKRANLVPSLPPRKTNEEIGESGIQNSDLRLKHAFVDTAYRRLFLSSNGQVALRVCLTLHWQPWQLQG